MDHFRDKRARYLPLGDEWNGDSPKQNVPSPTEVLENKEYGQAYSTARDAKDEAHEALRKVDRLTKEFENGLSKSNTNPYEHVSEAEQNRRWFP